MEELRRKILENVGMVKNQLDVIEDKHYQNTIKDIERDIQKAQNIDELSDSFNQYDATIKEIQEYVVKKIKELSQ